MKRHVIVAVVAVLLMGLVGLAGYAASDAASSSKAACCQKFVDDNKDGVCDGAGQHHNCGGDCGCGGKRCAVEKSSCQQMKCDPAQCHGKKGAGDCRGQGSACSQKARCGGSHRCGR